PLSEGHSLTNKVIKLNRAGILVNQDYQLQDGDEIDLLLDGYKQGTHLKFKFNLPKLDEKLVRNIVVLKQKDNTNDDDNNNNNNNNNNNEGNNSSDYSIMIFRKNQVY
ncbi:hypothetical protein INT46_006344, partial [Mucor plumbeus]